MKYIFAILLTLILSQPAQAFDFGAHMAGHFGYGDMGNETSDTYRDRGMGTFDLQAMPGLHVYGNNLLVGLMLDYRFLSQLSREGGLRDFSGRSFLAGPGASYELSFGKLLFAYDMRARHYLASPDTTYKGSGYHFLFGYRLIGDLFLDLEYVVVKYNAVNVSGTETGLDFPVSHANFGLGLSWSF
ncbi:MAG TPA: hypothetical protein VIH99_12500 [Bdellovibrionota bacterium]|jgi:hypothetical protein